MFTAAQAAYKGVIMATVVRLTKEIEKRLDDLAKKTGQTKSFYIREAIKEKLNDLEDICLSDEVMLRIRVSKEKIYKFDEVAKAFGDMINETNLAWTFEFTETATKQLKEFDKQIQEIILQYLRDNIAMLDDPREKGRILTGKFVSYWCYRVGDYRVICDINIKQFLILVIRRYD